MATVNESILLIETAGLAWWGGLLLIAFAASALLLFDRPALARSASLPKLEPLHAHEYEVENEEERKAA